MQFSPQRKHILFPFAKTKWLVLFEEMIPVYFETCIIHTNISVVGNTQSYWTLTQAVHIVTTELYRFIYLFIFNIFYGAFSVTQTIQRRMIGGYVNDELERI
jgi:hypothetical protein